MPEFWIFFKLVFLAMLRVWLIILCGFLAFQVHLINKKHIHLLSSLTINLLLPCYIFSHFLDNLTGDLPQRWWICPILGMVICGLGFTVGKIFMVLTKQQHYKQEFISTVSFQNCGYLPLILAISVFPADVAKILVTNIFLFIQGFNFIFWGFGVQLLKPAGSLLKIEFRKVLNAPFMALIFSMILIYTKSYKFFPSGLINITQGFGILTLPVALIILGAILAECILLFKDIKSTKIVNKPLVKSVTIAEILSKVILIKLIIMPAIILIFIYLIKIPKIMSLLLVLEAAMPSAINLSVVTFYQKAKSDFIAAAVFLTHILGVITIPLFLAIGKMIIGI
ncbi:MAG: AEC family transporter [Candidatus Omnitrophota bacterium]